MGAAGSAGRRDGNGRAAGFDPNLGIPAAADELVAPAGLLLMARLREEPVGCGAVKFHPGRSG
ncbi:MAG TPA: hypothetical protein VHN80_27785 [Kineosporiaceae bacterium]|nr:hypothetical protein [Kineosporiaceae bacterium]